MLVSKNTKICLTPNAKHKICVSPNANPQRKSMEYRLGWVANAKFQCNIGRVAHVHFIFVYVDFIRVLGPIFRWNMGLRIAEKSHFSSQRVTGPEGK